MLEEFVFGYENVLPHTQKSLWINYGIKFKKKTYYIIKIVKERKKFAYMFNPAYLNPYVVMHISKHFSTVIEAESIKFVTPPI